MFSVIIFTLYVIKFLTYENGCIASASLTLTRYARASLVVIQVAGNPVIISEIFILPSLAEFHFGVDLEPKVTSALTFQLFAPILLQIYEYSFMHVNQAYVYIKHFADFCGKMEALVLRILMELVRLILIK